jgi:hypothetical protein
MARVPRGCIRVRWSSLLRGWRADCWCLWARTYTSHPDALNAGLQHLHARTKGGTS